MSGPATASEVNALAKLATLDRSRWSRGTTSRASRSARNRLKHSSGPVGFGVPRRPHVGAVSSALRAKRLGAHGPSLPAGEADRLARVYGMRPSPSRQRTVEFELPPTQHDETSTPAAPLVAGTHTQCTYRDTLTQCLSTQMDAPDTARSTTALLRRNSA